jgi:RNA polymerase sigma factor (sigma-70 family)
MQQIETHTRIPSQEWVTIYPAPAPRKTIAQRLKEKRPARTCEAYEGLEGAYRNPRTHTSLCATASPFASSTRRLHEQFVDMPLYEPGDFIHDAIVAYLQRVQSLDTLVKNPAGYIATTIKNKGRNHVTRNKRLERFNPPATENDEEPHEGDGRPGQYCYVTSWTPTQERVRTRKYDALKRKQRKRRRYLQCELALLPEPVREVVTLYHSEGMTLDAIVERLGNDRSTVTRRLKRGREELSEIIRSGRAVRVQVIPPHKRAYTYGGDTFEIFDIEEKLLEELYAPDIPEPAMSMSESLQRLIASGRWDKDNPIYRALHSSLL